MLLIFVNPGWTALDVVTQTSLFIYCEDGLHPVIRASIREQFNSLLGTPLEIAFRQIIITHCDNLCNFPS
ncbi:hypothetical protein Y032_0479g2224 [Ancylostoma ceylanicum]|uniref:Uncharacterized protein n=1 Tax=Ancylostoma ceylanicum TaxID=53326 RepID=A0A016WXS9_9BILA|nr:hypothetical protein Y032_0479g2224 [Ancylostoma ceylanicum]